MGKNTSKEFAQGLFHVLKKFLDHFYEDFSQRAQAILGIKFDETQLVMTMLEYMFNKGQPDKRLVRADLQFFVANHVSGMMKFIIDFRKNYEIADIIQ